MDQKKVLDFIFNTFSADYIASHPEIVDDIEFIKMKIKQNERLKKLERIFED